VSRFPAVPSGEVRDLRVSAACRNGRRHGRGRPCDASRAARARRRGLDRRTLPRR
jgi:hypothetical protein